MYIYFLITKKQLSVLKICGHILQWLTTISISISNAFQRFRAYLEN